MAIDYTKLSDSDLRAIAANNVSALSDEALRMIAGQSAAVSKPVSAPSTERSWGDVAKDIPAGVLSGVGSLLQVPGQLVGLVPGMKGVGEALEAPGEAVQKFGTDLKSAGLKAREALRSQSISEAAKDGILSEFATAITSTLKDPALITSFITEQAPLLIGPLGAARLTAKLGMGGVEAAGAAAAKGLTGEAAEIASKQAMDVAAKQLGKRATTAAIGTGAAMEAGDTSSETYERTLNRALEMGMSREDAEAAAINASRIAAAGAGAVSLGANIGLSKLGGAAIERALAGLPGKGRVQGAFGEATSETLEGSGAQVFQNIGVRTVDPNQSLTEGVGAAAGLSALGGGFFGGMLSKKPDADLAPGQRPGESLYDTAARLNREIKNIEDLAKLGDTDQGRTDSGLMTNMQLVDMYREQGYGAVRQYQQQLVDRANDPTTPPEQKVAAQQAVKEIQDLFKQVTQEEVSRRMPSEQSYKITASDLTQFDIKGSDPVYSAAFGKDISDPVQVQEIQDAIDAELNRKGIRQKQAARLMFFKEALDLVVETLPAGGLRATTTVEPSGGDGAGVAGVSVAEPATGGVGAVEPSGVVSTEPVATESAAGKAEPTTPVMEDDITPQGTTGVVSEEKPAPAKQFTYEPAGSGDSHLGFTFGQVKFDLSNVSGKPQLVVTDPNRDGPIVFYAEGKKYDPRPNIYGSEQITEMVPSLPQGVASSLQNWLSSKTVDPAQGQKVADALNGYKAPAAAVTTSVSSLPKDLAGAKPRYSYGNKAFQLQFNSDIDKALYITAQKTPSRRDADYRAWLGKQGFTPEQITQEGQRVREAIKGVAAKADPAAGPINLPEQVKKPTVKKSLAPEVKDKLEPIYKRLEQRVKTAKPEAKPEAKAEEAPKEKTQKEALMERRAELIKELDGILKKILAKYNLTGVTLNLEEGMEEEGSYSGQIIKLALNLENPVRVLRHESIHALKDMGFFSDAQWKTLVKKAQDEWVDKYLKNREHNEDTGQSRYEAYVELLTKEGKNPTEVQEAIIEEAIADAFGDFDVNGAPPGLMAAIHRRMKNLFKAIKEAFGQAGIDTAEEIFGKIEKGSLKPAIPVGKKESGEFNAWKATEADVEKAEAYEEKNGIRPYVSEGRLDLPTKYSIKSNVEKYGQDPILGIPLNKDGTVTVYYHTVKPNVFQINSSKIIPAEGRDRIYLTNESSGAKVYGSRGNFDQELDGSVVLLNINPSLLQIDQEYDDGSGRKDFFVPLTQGDFFNKKMQAAAIQAPRTKAIVEEFSYKEHQDRITKAVKEYNDLTGKEKQALLKKARAVLKKEHNIGTLMTENGKLEKTRMGDYGLLWDGKPIDSMGLGLAAAQQISEKLSTCPNSAICQGLCLGETSGGNFLYGGAAREDVEDIEKTAFRAGPRMVQYLKTEALIVHPEEFAIVLQSEIDTLKKWDNSPTYRKKNKETGKLETLDKEIYQSAVRLNVTSDFKPEMWSSLIDANPDVMFYDYTKMMGETPIAPNHHLTYSSTGFGQKIDGKDVFFKTKAGRYNHNWPQVRNRLNAGYNVAMAFSSKSALPKTLVDEETGVTYNILDGDDYDARFLDEKSPLKQGGIGVIVGLRNKASTLKEKTASKETDGFFVDYDPKQDGDSVTVLDQTQFGAPSYKAPGKTIPIEKKSLRSQAPEFKFWFGQSKIVDKDGKPKVMYHGTARDITEFKPKQANAIFLTDNPDFAESFAAMSARWMGRHADQFLSSKQLEAGKKSAIAKIKKDYNKGDLLRQKFIDAINGESNDFYEDAMEYVGKEYQRMLPSAENIMPVFIKAEYPFDYENKDHIDALYKGLVAELGEDFAGRRERYESGDWSAIEDETVQMVIKQLGFDSFYVSEGTNKNLAVYSPTQIVSATGNVGAYGQRPITAEEAARFDMTEEQAAEAQKRGDIRFSLRSAPTTPEFKRWFGDSKVVDADGKPMVVFHASTNFEGYEFKKSPKVNRTGNPDGYYFSPSPSDAADYARDLEYVADRINNPEKYDRDYPIPYAQGAEIIPVYLSVKNPYDYKAKTKPSREMIRQFEKELREDNPNLGDDWISEKLDIFKEGRWPSISFPTDAMTRVIKSGGYDGMKDGRHWIAFDSNQIKSATGNIGTYDVTSPDIRRSLRSTLPASAINAMDRIAPPRYNPGWAEKIMNAVTGDTFTSIRQKFINRYERLAEYDRRVAKQIRQMGGVQQLADSKAETAALFSDLGAGVLEAVMGVHDRVGGAPIFRNGVTTVSNYGGTVKGLLEIFRPISDSKDPDMFRMYQTWAAVKRGMRLDVEGREDLIKPAEIRAINDLKRSNPDMIRTFEAVQKDWLAYNNALVKYQVDTGVISPEMAKEWTKHGDYFPFYRLMDGDDIAGPKTFSSIGNVKPPKKLKGGEDPLGDFFENIVRNSQAAIQAGMKNVAAQRATEQAMRLNEVTRLTTKQTGVNVYRVYENGKEVYYKSHDPLFIEAIKALNMADIPFMGLLAKPASMLRNLVTKDPAFMLANMMRDSLSAWATTGVKMTPVLDTLNNFSKAIAGKSPELDMLYSAGILGGYDYALGSKEAAREFETQLRRRSGKLTAFEIGTKPARSLWEALEKGTQASDAATRMEVYKKTLAATGSEAEALAAALEVMNFNRKGNNPMIRVLTAAVPFLNARIQGLDVLFRTAIMPLGGSANEQAQQRMKTFWVRGMTMLFLSSAYWLLTHDDEDYKKQEQETRDNNWLIPSLGIKIPIPFEVGVMFKVIPERIMALSFGTDTSKDFTDSMKRQFVSTFAFNPIPQVVLPLYEAKTNYSFFTDRPIIGKGLENVADKYQVGPSTSRVAQMIGDSVGFSPMKVDHLLKGYFGTIGTYASDLFDMVYDMGADSPKASKRFEQMPVIKRFAVDPEARGTVTAYYKLKDEVDQAVRTANLLERSNNFAEGTKYTLENLRLLATDDYVKDIEKSMKDYREMKQQIMAAPYSADTKRDLLKSIGKMESLTTANIQNIKKFAQ